MNSALARSLETLRAHGVVLDELPEVLDVTCKTWDVVAVRHTTIRRLRRKKKSVRWIARTMGLTENTVHGVLRAQAVARAKRNSRG